MTNRKIRLVIERNKSRFSDNCSVLVDDGSDYMNRRKPNVISLEMPKWMRDMLGDDYSFVRSKVDDMGREFIKGFNGMEILIKI